MNKLKVIELFAGIGAQRQALKEAGINHEVVAISEVDKYALKAYESLHGDAPNLGDIRKIEKLPIADMWTYSFPCTDISLAGRLGGFEKGGFLSTWFIIDYSIPKDYSSFSYYFTNSWHYSWV